MKIILDKPPALNHLYNVNYLGAKFLTTEGKVYKEKIAWELKATGVKFKEKVPVSLTVLLHTCRHQDNDGILKILMDAIQYSGMIKDDFWIFDLRVMKIMCIKEYEKIEIEMTEIKW